MNFSNPKWADAALTQIDVTLDTGETIRINAIPGLLHYDALVASGVAIAPYTPQTVTPRQARIALLQAGLLDQVEAAVKAAGGATQITWDYATEINRTDPLITTLGASLKLDDATIDVLFKHAATL